MRGSGDGLVPWPTKPVTPGVLRMTYQRVVVEVAAHQQVAGEHLLLDDDLLAVLELDDVFHRDDDLVDALLHVHGRGAGLEVLLDLLLVARLGVDHVPLARPVVGALDRRRLGEQVVLVEDRRSASLGVDCVRRLRLVGVGLGGVGVVGVGVGAPSVGGRRRRRVVVGVVVGDRRSTSGHWLTIQRTDSPKHVVEGGDEGGEDDEGDEHDDRVVDGLRPGRPGDLAQLGPDLADELRAGVVRCSLGAVR